MNDSLKLSYEMLFENTPGWGNASSPEDDISELISPEELEQMLEKKDEEWQKKMDEACKEAHKKGFNQGFAEGKANAEQKFKTRLTGFEKMTDAIDQEIRQTLDELNPYLAQLVFDITEKVLDIPFKHHQLQKKIQHEVEHLIEKLDEELHIKMMVSEDDLDLMQEAIGNHEHFERVTLRSGKKLNPGEYVLETSKEYIIKKFRKIIADFKESISFSDTGTISLNS